MDKILEELAKRMDENFAEVRRAATESAISIITLGLLLMEKGVFTEEEFDSYRAKCSPMADQLIAKQQAEREEQE